MQTTRTPIVKDLVLVGGGHSHLAVLKYFGMKPVSGLRITLITRDLHTPYSGMLPGYIAGHYDFDQAHIDLRRLTRFAGIRIYHSEVSGLDLAKKQVICANRPPVPYDVLSINTGSRPGTLQVPGAAGLGLPVKPIDSFLGRWEVLVRRVLDTRGPFCLLVVGGGAGGVEMALATQYRLQQTLRDAGQNAEQLSVQLVTDSTQILPTHNDDVRKRFERVLSKRNIRIYPGHAVNTVVEHGVICDNGNSIPGDAVLWVTSASAPAWPGESGLAVDEHGFILVNDYLQSSSHPQVFAAGDVAASIRHPRPKSGVFAVRQGLPLAKNIQRYLHGRTLKSFRPQLKFLSLISTGDKYSIASRSQWSLEGAWTWHLKDWIDRRFMHKYSDLPEMSDKLRPQINPQLTDQSEIKEIFNARMRCGGCGAKVGSDILSKVLNRLQPVQRADILIGLNSAEDAAVSEIPPGKSIVQSVDYFRSFIDDPYVFGQIAANHALSDIFAMGAEAQTAMAIATLPYGLEDDVEEQLYQLMSGALRVLNQSNAALVGGHSSEGAELAFGLAVTGLVDRDKILHKGGMQAGDILLLSKPLGTGTLFAADMRHAAKGRWIDAAIGHMLNSNQAAGLCLQRHAANACTDVTGFGLLGHLLEMMKLSNVDVRLEMDSLPILNGAIQTISNGIFSSLHPQNIRLQRAIRNINSGQQYPSYPLLFDPQTAGGLLASIPASAAQDCVKELVKLGYPDAVVIGKVLQKSGQSASIELH